MRPLWKNCDCHHQCKNRRMLVGGLEFLHRREQSDYDIPVWSLTIVRGLIGSRRASVSYRNFQSESEMDAHIEEVLRMERDLLDTTLKHIVSSKLKGRIEEMIEEINAILYRPSL